MSHELKNPLNSIIQQNLGTHYNIKQVKEIIDQIKKIADELENKALK